MRAFAGTNLWFTIAIGILSVVGGRVTSAHLGSIMFPAVTLVTSSRRGTNERADTRKWCSSPHKFNLHSCTLHIAVRYRRWVKNVAIKERRGHERYGYFIPPALRN
jgi:hypothetical protein